MNSIINFNKKILITGGEGFLGKHLIKKLKFIGYKNLISISRTQYDLTKERDIKKLFNKSNIDFVIHLASSHGGLYYNISQAGHIMYQNLLMNTLLMHYSMLNKVEKFICAGTVDSYPKDAKVPFKEKDIWNGYPHNTSASYAFSKKLMIVQGYAYKKQYNFNSIHLLFMNLYGPMDDFEITKCHVIPAIISKINDAMINNKKHIKLFGSGLQKREFLYVKDAVDSIILALNIKNYSEPINIGNGNDISIKKLAFKISSLMGYKGEIKWDKSKPIGYKIKSFNVNKAKKILGFKAKTKLEEGLIDTIKWYKNNIVK